MYDRPRCKESVFGKMLANETALLNPSTREAKQFCGRCPLPYQVFFKELMKCVQKEKWFVDVESDIVGHLPIPPEVQLRVVCSVHA